MPSQGFAGQSVASGVRGGCPASGPGQHMQQPRAGGGVLATAGTRVAAWAEGGRPLARPGSTTPASLPFNAVARDPEGGIVRSMGRDLDSACGGRRSAHGAEQACEIRRAA